MTNRPRAKLLRNYITKGGSFYNGGVTYPENTLPALCYLDDSLVRILEPDEVVKRQVEQISSDTDLSSIQSKAEQATRITKIEPSVEIIESTTKVEGQEAPKPKVIQQVEEVTPQITEYSYLNKTPIQINTIKEVDFVDVKGLGSATFKKVAEARELSPFMNMSDLSERIDLNGRWQKYNLDFSIPE